MAEMNSYECVAFVDFVLSRLDSGAVLEGDYFSWSFVGFLLLEGTEVSWGENKPPSIGMV